MAEVPRDRSCADWNARAIYLFPQIFRAARNLSDSAGGDFVTAGDGARVSALLAEVKGFRPSDWRCRRRSVWQFASRPLVAHASDERWAAAIATLPQLVGSLRFLIGSADSEPIQRVAPSALPAVRNACWDGRLNCLWTE